MYVHAATGKVSTRGLTAWRLRGGGEINLESKFQNMLVQVDEVVAVLNAIRVVYQQFDLKRVWRFHSR